MGDLRSQLAAAFGRTDDRAAPEPVPVSGRDGVLADGAWRHDPWADALRSLLPKTPGAPRLPADVSLAHQKQITDQLAAKLKKLGQKRERQELLALRGAFLSKRDGAAWAQVKAVFAEHQLSDKAYRRLKQEGVDPVAALDRLEAVDRSELTGMGAARLHALLTA